MAYDPSPRLVKWTFIPLWVAWMINIFSHWSGDGKGFGSRVDGTLCITIGLWTLWAGAFGSEYKYRRRDGGGPMPTWQGRALFTFVALMFIAVGMSKFQL